MNAIKKIIGVCGLLAGGLLCHGQEYTITNQYHFHYYLLNPALAGAAECTHFMLTHKQQWVGMKEAPYTTALSFQTRTKSRIGVGAYLYNDRNGWSYQQGGQATIAYHIPLSKGNRYTKSPTLDRQLSFAASMNFYRYSLSDKVIDQSKMDGDAINEKNGFYPNANFGVFYQDYKFFTGLTLTNLIPVEISMFGEDEPKRPFSFFWQVGYAFGCGRNTSFEPSLVFKMDADSRKQIDVNVRFIQHREDQDLSWWAGVGYKHNLDDGGGQSLVLLPNATVRIGKFRVGYAFNLDLNKLLSHNYGTHELMLGYSFCHTSKFCR
jgi:type IX secretion system PorP/SprF family membrane protein